MQDASRVPNLGLRVPNQRKHPIYIYIYIYMRTCMGVCCLFLSLLVSSESSRPKRYRPAPPPSVTIWACFATAT